MPSRNHSHWIRDYVATYGPRGEAPDQWHFWTAVSTVGGALRRRVYADEEHYQHYPNFFIVLVGPPGTKKSTTIGQGSRMLREVPNIHIGADCTTWQSLVQDFENARDVFAEGDPIDFQNMSEEAVADALLHAEQTNTHALSLQISEWGTFLDPNDKMLVNILTELFDGKTGEAFKKATKTQGSNTLINPFLNMLAATTDQWMHDNFSFQFGGWGFASRCIFVYGARNVRRIAFGSEMWSGQGINKKAVDASFVEDLCQIASLKGRVSYTPDAREFMRAFYDEHGDRQDAVNSHRYHDPWLSQFFARKFDHCNKVAITLCASRGADLTINLEDCQLARQACDDLEAGISSIFSSERATTREGKLNQDVLNHIANAINKAEDFRMPKRLVLAYTSRFMTYHKANELLDFLVVTRLLALEEDVGGKYYSLGSEAPPQYIEQQNLIRVERGLPPIGEGDAPTAH